MIRGAVFASGTGTNAVRLFEKAEHLKNLILPVLVVDRPGAPVIETVRRRFPAVEILLVDEKTREAREETIISELRAKAIDWCFLAGFMRILSSAFLKAFKDPAGFNRVVNIHPSLLPAYPGMDAYERAFAAGEKTSGVTVHLVDEGIDTGPVLLQRAFMRVENETLESFIEKGKQLEWSLYPKVLEMLDRNLTLIAIPEGSGGTSP
ncbi:MAG: phosphoribosylglycinamide formyltransferase, partial [Proteobacteria bacterium]|nr:phosphoribosylglycinamide formyltransferase [Pseudomonadota bacterium]